MKKSINNLDVKDDVVKRTDVEGTGIESGAGTSRLGTEVERNSSSSRPSESTKEVEKSSSRPSEVTKEVETTGPSTALVQEFNHYLVNTGLSSKTITSYVGDVTIFLKYLCSKGVAFNGTLTRFYITSYKQHLLDTLIILQQVQAMRGRL